MPSWEIFEYYCRKHPDYRESVFPSSVSARVSVELAGTFGWERYVGSTGRIIGMESFGASAPLTELSKKFGFAVANIVEAAKEDHVADVLSAREKDRGGRTTSFMSPQEKFLRVLTEGSVRSEQPSRC